MRKRVLARRSACMPHSCTELRRRLDVAVDQFYNGVGCTVSLVSRQQFQRNGAGRLPHPEQHGHPECWAPRGWPCSPKWRRALLLTQPEASKLLLILALSESKCPCGSGRGN